jgi:hypothetical protein
MPSIMQEGCRAEFLHLDFQRDVVMIAMRLITVTLVLAIPAPAMAQPLPQDQAPTRLVISDRAIALGMAAHPPAPPMQSRDSIKNGTIIGAVLGAVAMGGFVGWLCNALQEPGDPSCMKSALTGGALGAAIGAAAGAGIDALASRQPWPASTRVNWRQRASHDDQNVQLHHLPGAANGLRQRFSDRPDQ